VNEKQEFELPIGKGPIFDITDDERAHLFQSRTWSAEHLLALGRIVEVSASIEDRMRRLLGSALQIPQSGLGRRDYTSAAFLGVRASELTRRRPGSPGASHHYGRL
jgi:hypothetical protein